MTKNVKSIQELVYMTLHNFFFFIINELAYFFGGKLVVWFHFSFPTNGIKCRRHFIGFNPSIEQNKRIHSFRKGIKWKSKGTDEIWFQIRLVDSIFIFF